MKIDDFLNDTPRKKKKKYIKDWYFPAEVIALFYNGQINAKELILLGVINALTHTRPNGTIAWCFASNKYIGRLIQLSPNRVSIMVNKLCNEKKISTQPTLIVRSFKEKSNGSKQRYLKPAWRKKIQNQNHATKPAIRKR